MELTPAAKVFYSKQPNAKKRRALLKMMETASEGDKPEIAGYLSSIAMRESS